MMDHIRQRDWCSTRNEHNQFVEEEDIDNCVIERIIRNKFWDPNVSSEDDEPVRGVDWDSVFVKKTNKVQHFRVFVPGFRKQPPYPRVSSLSIDEQRCMLKLLCSDSKHILPTVYLGRPSMKDKTLFEEKNSIYGDEQKEFLEWAKHLWLTTNCIRALRPKPLVETVYEAEFNLKSQMIQSFPKAYKLAAQIPLRAENHTCDIILPKTDLIKVDISRLPKVSLPNITEVKESILQDCPLPEPCKQHPCQFTLPYETESSLLPLTEINKELAQYALENGAGFVASESSLKCLLETDRSWSLPISVCEVIGPEINKELAQYVLENGAGFVASESSLKCLLETDRSWSLPISVFEVIGPDGDTSNVVVIGSEFADRREPAPMRSYKAFRHLLLNACTGKSTRSRTFTDRSDSSNPLSVRPQPGPKPPLRQNNNKPPRARKVSSDSHKAAVSFNTAVKKIANLNEASDSDEESRLEIDLEDDSQTDSQNASDIDEENHISEIYGNISNETPRKILKAKTRLSARGNISKKDNKALNQMDHQEIAKSPDNKKADNVENALLQMHTNSINKSVRETEIRKSSENSQDNTVNTTTKDVKSKSSSIDSQDSVNITEQDFEFSLYKCVCKGSAFETQSPRSYKSVQLINFTTKEQINLIIHSSHKLKNGWSYEVMMEPLLEYQLDIGGTMLSPEKIQSLTFSLMLRKNAELNIVRVDGTCGEVVTIDTCDMREWSARHGDLRASIANTLLTTLNQLASLRPTHYLLRHEPSHGNNALLLSRAVPGAPDTVPLQGEALSPAEEARLVQQPPRLGPVLLPFHKFRRQLPLAFTHNPRFVAKESKQAAAKKKTPPAALQAARDEAGGNHGKWPKKKGRKGKKRKTNVNL